MVVFIFSCSDGLPFLQMHPGLLITFAVEVVEQIRLGVAREFAGESVNAGKKGREIGLGVGGRHLRHRALQFQQGVKNAAFSLGYHGADGATARAKKHRKNGGFRAV